MLFASNQLLGGFFQGDNLSLGDGGALLAVVHLVAPTDGGVVGVLVESMARGVEAVGLDLPTHVTGGFELQHTTLLQVNHLALTLVGVQVFALGLDDDTEGTEGVDGDAGVLILGESVTELIEEGRQHLFDGGLADAAALGDVGCQLGKVGFLDQFRRVLNYVKRLLQISRFCPRRTEKEI